MAPAPTTERRGPGRPRRYDHDVILAAVDAGIRIADIARMYGCHAETVRYIVNKRRAR